MENQPRLPWLSRLATLRAAAEIDNQAQPEPAQPAPPVTTGRQPILPVSRVPMVPQPGPQPRAPAPPPPQPASQPTIRPLQPVQPNPRPVTPPQPNPRPVTPPQPNPRPVTPPQPTPTPVTPPQQDIPKPVLPASNGASPSPRTAPSPPPSPKVIKTSNPTPPPSPRVTTVPQAPPISVSNDKAANPEAEIMPTPELSRLKTIAMQEERDTKANGNGGSYNNTNTTNGIYGSADTGSKMNDSTYKNGNKINNGTNGKVTFSDFKHNNTNLATQPERNGTENGHGMFEERAKHHHQHHHLNSNTTMSNPHHKKSEKDMKVITIAGENLGAFMELGHNVHGYGRKMHHGGHSLTSGPVTHDGKATTSKDNKGVVRAKPVTSLVNSNVQSINNSLLFNSSCAHKSPGVYLTLKSKSKGKAHKPSLDSPSS